MKQKLIIVILGVVLAVGCYDEDALTSTETPEYNYTLPQGDHPYDAKIVDWFDRCGFYILYKFEPRDAYWNIRTWLGADADGATYLSFLAPPANEAYVDGMLDVLERKMLNFYPDTMLRRCMPIKVLLCDSIRKSSSDPGYLFQFDCLLLSGAKGKLQSKQPSEMDVLKSGLNYDFLERLRTNGKITLSDEFFTVSSYNETYDSKTKVVYSYGYINTWSQKKGKDYDWKEFVEAIVKTPYKELTAEPDSPDYAWQDFKGILHEKRDVKGLIRKKYDIMIRYFKDMYGVDLQKIGDANEVVKEE